MNLEDNTFDNYISGVIYEQTKIINKERDKQTIEAMTRWAKENSTILKQYNFNFIDEEVVEHIIELGIKEYLKEIDPFKNIEMPKE